MENLHKIQWVLEFINKNPVIGAIFGVTGLGALIGIVVSVPTRISAFIRRYMFTTVIISDQENNNVIRGIGLFMSHIKVRRKEWSFSIKGYNEITPSGGSYWIFFHGNIIFCSSYRKENETGTVSNVSTFSTFGRSTRIINEFINEAMQMYFDSMKTQTVVLKLLGSSWRAKTFANAKRDMDTVVLQKDVKKKLINHFENFMEEEKWCTKFGIPWRTGIILEGPPGTGKTSFIKALADKYNKSIYIASSEQIYSSSFSNAVMEIPPGSVLVIEDIDAVNMNREMEDNDEIPTFADPSYVQKAQSKESIMGNMSNALNALDGIVSAHGLITIATTNHINRLDKALIRPGRFDLIVRIDYMGKPEVEEYLSMVYDTNITIENDIIEGLSPAKLQKMVRENKNNPKVVLDQITVSSSLDKIS